MKKINYVKCSICGKQIANTSIKRHEKVHERVLKEKKNRVAWNKGLTKELDNRLTRKEETKRKIGKNTTKTNLERWKSIENKIKQSERMILVAKDHPESYGISNRSRAKHYEYKGERFQGTWELEFFKYCERNKIECKRNRECFPYFWKEKIHYYYPDFYLEKFNLFIEIKGYETDRDVAKQRDFPSDRKLLILRKKEYDLFIKDQFILDL